MALSNLKSMRNKWALHAWKNQAIFIKLGDIDYPAGRIWVEEIYQTNPISEIRTIDIGSNFDNEATVCRKNISSWLKVFYPNLRKVS